MSRVLIIATLVFLALASSVLVWDGLAIGVGPRPGVSSRELWRGRSRLTVGVVVLAIVLWIALGMVTRVW